MKPIADRAEVTIDLPDKLYMGSFTRHSNYAVKADGEQVGLRLSHAEGAHRVVELHLHYFLLADVLRDLAQELAVHPSLDEPHRQALEEAAKALLDAVASGREPG